MHANEFEPLLEKVAAAIDNHPKLHRAGEPSFNIDRLGVSVKILVKLAGSRKKATGISGTGDTTEEAVEKLISTLDIWAQAIA